MDRLERLLDLVHVLQTARRPVPFSALRETFADYGEGSHESIRRKFERDKAELARIGLVLRYEDDDEGEAGYWLDADASYLPDFSMSEEERAIVATSARAALADPSFPHRRALRLALAKLGAEAGDASAFTLSHGRPTAYSAASVEALGGALASRKRVRLRHRKPGHEPTERELDPYGLFLRAGAWYVVGFDHRSKEVRVFDLGRIESMEVNGKKPGAPDFDVPDDFEIRPLMNTSPLRYAVHESTAVAVRVDEEVAFLKKRDWGTPEGGVFRFSTTNLAYVIDEVLALGRRAELLSPALARDQLAAIYAEIAAAHAPAEEGTP
ncbi:MAG: WYL domain-containing protein [Myxococcota bacterium]